MGSADYLDIDGRLGFVETYGSGRPVLCVHTAGQHGFQYRYAARAIAERGFQAAQDWLRATRQAISSCDCEAGCPSCVQSPKCGNANHPLSKRGAVALLDALLASSR